MFLIKLHCAIKIRISDQYTINYSFQNTKYIQIQNLEPYGKTQQKYKRNGDKVVVVYSVQISHFTVGDAGRQGPRPNTLHIWG